MLENNVSLITGGLECDNSSVIYTEIKMFTDNKSLLTAVAVCLSVIAAFTVFTNILVIVAVCYSHPSVRNNGGSYKKITFKLLMASLALGDAIIGGFIMPVTISDVIHNGRWIFPKGYCKYFGMMDIVLCTASIYHVMFMAVDRYLAICLPLTHRSLTAKSGFAMAGLCWIVPALIFFVATFFDLMSEPIVSGSCGQTESCRFKAGFILALGGVFLTILAPFFVTCVLYALILCQVKRFLQRKSKKLEFKVGTRSKLAHEPISTVRSCLESNSSSCNGSVTDLQRSTTTLQSEEKFKPKILIPLTDNDIISTNNTTIAENKIRKSTMAANSQKNSANRSAHKAFITIGLLVFCFAACWCPYSLFLCVQALGKESDFPRWLVSVVSWMGLLNSTLNPLLFCSHRDMRESLKRLLTPQKSAKII